MNIINRNFALEKNPKKGKFYLEAQPFLEKIND